MSVKCLEDLLSGIESFSNFSITPDMKGELLRCYNIINKEIRSHKLKGEFESSINKERVPYLTLEEYINEIEEKKDNIGFEIVGSLALISLYNEENKQKAITSNVIDIVCKEKYCVDEIKKKSKERGFSELREDIFKVCFSKNNKKICFPNQIGYYVYLKKDNVYVFISIEGSINLKLSGFDETYYINNVILFTILYKFFRFKPKDIYDLISLNNYVDRKKWEKIPKEFDKEDKEKILKIFGERGIKKILENYRSFMENYPDTIYKELDIERILN
jgi:hypothetical protein